MWLEDRIKQAGGVRETADYYPGGSFVMYSATLCCLTYAEFQGSAVTTRQQVSHPLGPAGTLRRDARLTNPNCVQALTCTLVLA